MACVDGGSLIMVDELLQGVEFALANAVHGAFHVDAEVFVPTGGFQGNRKVTNL